jgi:hypothetical protein
MDRENKGGRQYKQLKISADPAIVSNFKNTCAAYNVSMASKLTEFMVEFSNAATAATRKPVPDYTTKRQRRNAINKIVKQLEEIRGFEQDYCDRIPENLQNSITYQKAEEFLEYLDTAIETLISIDSI